MTRSLWVFLLSLGALAWWKTAQAQPMLQQVATDAAVTVAVPGGLRSTPGLSALPDTPPLVVGLATFTDDGEKPLSIQIRKGEPHGWESLPAASAKVVGEWTQRFAAGLQLPEAYDFTPGRYDPERGALSLQYKVVGPSSARLMQRLPNSHPLWSATLAEGEDPNVAKCVLDALLVGQPSASPVELRARTGITAAVCSLPEALVVEYLQQLGTAEFAPAVTTVTYISFFTRLGTIGTLIMAPLERQDSVDKAAELIWHETEVAEDARLPTASSTDLIRLAQLGGIVLGAFLGVLVLGGALSWLLVRFGLRAPLAVGSTLGLLCALSLIGWLRGGFQLAGAMQVGGFVLASALAFRPLVRWLSSRGGTPLGRARSLRRSRGLTTVEYVVVLVLLACVAIGTWQVFGRSVKKAIFNSTEQLDAVANTAFDDFGPGGSREPSAQAGPTPTASRGSDTRRADTASNAGPARRSGAGVDAPGGARQPARGATGATGPTAARESSGSARPGAESRGSPVQAAGIGLLQGMLPGPVVPPAAPRIELPPNAGRVLASAAKEPSLLLRGADIATDLVPWVSNAKDAAIAVTGVNPVTGEHVGTFGRVVSGVFAIPGAGNLLKYVGKGGKYVLKGGKAAYEAVEAARAASKLAKAAEREVAQGLERQAERQIAKQVEERAAKEAAAAGVLATSRRLGTEANQAVFWSGLGKDGDLVAKAWVEKNGGKTMERVLEERGIKLPSYPTNGSAVPEATEKAWRDASREFAQGASGDVRVLQQDAVRADRVWAEVEYKTLLDNPNVKSITAVDPRTGGEILLWKR
ncbi:MAG: pre-toxin TG domain-containing protein [Deltaproteobacteria bacterium]